MEITVPIYVQEVWPADAEGTGPSTGSRSSTRPKQGSPTYKVQPLFFASPARSHKELKAALGRIEAELKENLKVLAAEPRHEGLASFAFNPDVEEHLVDVTLELKQRSIRCRILIVTFEHIESRLAFWPSLPDAFFEVAPGSSLKERAQFFLSRHLRELEKQEEDLFFLDDQSSRSRAWITLLDVEVLVRQRLPKPPKLEFALLGTEGPPDGRVELERVGRCLDQLDPDETPHALGRDEEVLELKRLLTRKEQRPLLLVGPRQAGKTAIIHEYVRRFGRSRGGRPGLGQIWLLAPGRLISGMMYVGQWESRLTAILTFAEKHSLVLYFDDLLGLLHAGVSASSSLNVAQVLKPAIEGRNVRVLAEITPEMLQVLRERDRGFADLFHILPVREMSELETHRVMIHQARQLEKRTRAKFDLEVLPLVHTLQRRYVRDACFPGKSALFLERLAIRHRNNRVGRDEVLAAFQAQTGMPVSFLDDRQTVRRDEVLAALGREVVGQVAALEAMADAVCVAKARLNDPERPLATLLFLGPTGVGKTQCAQSLARYLFGSSERILRFDMNEYVSASSASQLVGTFWEPEGQLTAAIRRQPYSVVLLDEIEKAHPNIFNLLLQVMGEGRLTDALGRTADFTRAILILTSNLGAREVASLTGFDKSETQEQGRYLSAVEQFFAPEFVNRIDRIIPFNRLSRADMDRIARILLTRVFRREGLVRRQTVLRIDPRAMEAFVDKGFDPSMGARALKRAVEQEIARPVARKLAGTTPDLPCVVSVYAGPGGLMIKAEPLVNCDLSQVQDQFSGICNLDQLHAVRARLGAVQDRVEAIGTRRGPISIEDTEPETLRHLRLTEEIRSCWTRYDEIEGALSPGASTDALVSIRTPRLARHRPDACWSNPRDVLRGLNAALDLNAYFLDLFSRAPARVLPGQGVDLLRQLALLEAVASTSSAPKSNCTFLIFESLDEQHFEKSRPIWSYLEPLTRAFLIAVESVLFRIKNGADGPSLTECDLPQEGLLQAEKSAKMSPTERDVDLGCQSAPIHWLRLVSLEGPFARALAAREAGVHLLCPAEGVMVPIRASLVEGAPERSPEEVVREHLETRSRWINALAEGERRLEEEPLPLGRVVRIYGESSGLLDCRTGLGGPRTDGSRTDDPWIDGPRTVGARTDGARTDGSRTVGSRTDGSRTVGALVDFGLDGTEGPDCWDEDVLWASCWGVLTDGNE